MITGGLALLVREIERHTNGFGYSPVRSLRRHGDDGCQPSYDAIIADVRGIERVLRQDDGGELFRDTPKRAKRLAKDSGEVMLLVLGEPESREWPRKGAIRVREELPVAWVL